MPTRAGPNPRAPGPSGPTANPMVRIRLFGEMDLRVDGQRLAPLESGRSRSLLAYLLLHDGPPQSRQRLAYLLWPDSTDGQARTNLRHLLHTLRTAAPAVDRFLEVSPATLRWRWETGCWLDVAEFEAAVGRAEHGGASPAEVVAALREAIDLYTGDLLEGCYDEWLVAARERLRDRYAQALERLSGLFAEGGEHAEAIRIGRELLRCDPLREDAYRLLMRLHDAAGDRAGGVRVYHECASTLQRELAVEPSAATTSEYAALMRPDQPSRPTPQEGVRVNPAVLVGRDDEWERLTTCWRDAEHGRALLVLVTGEPGIGKTRLVEELAGWCRHRGALVAEARSYPGEGELAYGVAISWLRSAEMAVHLRRAAHRDRRQLARLLPELAAEEPDADGSTTVDEAEERRRLFDALNRTLGAAGRPTLLVADDAQWCDEPSLQLIHYLVRIDPTRPLLVLGTVRREDLHQAHPLGALSAGLLAIDRASEMPLRRLARADTEELVRHLAGGDLHPTAVDGLYEETEGNPLFIVEMVRAGQGRSGASPPELTPKLQAVIDARLRQVSGPTGELLGLAATVGRQFTADVLRAASAVDDTALVPALDELWRRGIVREQGTDGYDFAHGKIRDVAYDALSPAIRRRNHKLIADALLALHERDVEAITGEIARHYDRAGEIEEAVTWYQRAATQAQRLYANAEAVRLLDRAGELVAALPEGAVRRDRELEVLSALPTPLAVVEGFASTRLAQAQQRLLRLGRDAGVEPEPTLLRSLVMTSLCRDDFDRARTAAGQLQALAQGDNLLLLETEYLLGIGAFWDGAFGAAQQHFERVGRQSDPARRAEHVLRFGHDPQIVCLSRLANTLWFLGRPNEARRARDEAVTLARKVGHPFSRGVAHVFAALLAVDLDEPDRYRDYVTPMLVDAQHQPPQIASEVFLGYGEVLEGRANEGIRRMRAAIGPRPVNHAPGQHACHARLLLRAYELAGDAEAGLNAADEVLALGGTRIWEAEHRRLRAAFLVARGASTGEVEAELGRAAEVARRQGALGLQRKAERALSDLRRTG